MLHLLVLLHLVGLGILLVVEIGDILIAVIGVDHRVQYPSIGTVLLLSSKLG